jgi:hypothetical protein
MKRGWQTNRRARRFVSLAAAFATVLVGPWLAPGRVSAASDAGEVTLNVSSYEDPRTGVRTWVFAGQIASGEHGEYVRVLGRLCGTKLDRLIGDAVTAAGGAWRAEVPVGSPSWPASGHIDLGLTFRAHWKDHVSNSHFAADPASLYITRIPGRRAWKVHISPTSGRHPGFAGKVVVLQRQRGVEWLTVRRARLAHRPSRRYYYNYEATFTVPTRGLTVRAFLPQRSALPCNLAGASKPWRT